MDSPLISKLISKGFPFDFYSHSLSISKQFLKDSPREHDILILMPLKEQSQSLQPQNPNPRVPNQWIMIQSQVPDTHRLWKNKSTNSNNSEDPKNPPKKTTLIKPGLLLLRATSLRFIEDTSTQVHSGPCLFLMELPNMCKSVKLIQELHNMCQSVQQGDKHRFKHVHACQSDSRASKPVPERPGVR